MSASIVSRRSNTVAREVGAGVTAILDLDHGVYYQVDAIGTAVWALLEMRPLTIEEMTSEIVAGHEVETEDCRRDVLAFVSEMAAAGLVEVGDGESR